MGKVEINMPHLPSHGAFDLPKESRHSNEKLKNNRFQHHLKIMTEEDIHT